MFPVRLNFICCRQSEVGVVDGSKGQEVGGSYNRSKEIDTSDQDKQERHEENDEYGE